MDIYQLDILKYPMVIQESCLKTKQGNKSGSIIKYNN